MKDGGQNEAIGSDPVYLPRVDTILPHMYNGGWSAVVDASKFFYQFPTVISERKYLGLIHPTTGVHYRALPTVQCVPGAWEQVSYANWWNDIRNIKANLFQTPSWNNLA